MRPTRVLTAVLLALVLALAPGLAFARAGGGSSMGSRGTRTYSAPPSTSTAPGTAAPMQRSMTTPSQPSTSQPGYGAAPAPARPGLFGGSPFMSGLFGGLLGAGIGGMLFGHGAFGGVSGFGGFLGFLIQIFLIILAVRFVLRLFRGRQPAFAGGAPTMARTGDMGNGMMGGGGAAPQGTPVQVQPADFQQFEQLLKAVQAAWTANDLRAMGQLVSPEMLSYFAEQLGEMTSRGVRNSVTDVRLEQGDLSEAWNEQGRDYATVAMRFSMIDVTTDSTGRVVEGNPSQRAMATEIWTFMRAPGGHWILSAIQQTR